MNIWHIVSRKTALLPIAIVAMTMLWLMNGPAVAQQLDPQRVSDDRSTPTPQPKITTADGSISSTQPVNPAAADLTGPDAPGSPAVSFSYYKVIGTAFQPRESTSTFAYSTNGCMYQTGGPTFRFQAPLVLPEDSIIKYVRIYYMDTAATNMTVWLTRYEPGQANLDLVSVSSTGAAGYGTVLSPLITQTVDMATYAYVLTWGTSVATSANQICGIRVAYYAPPFSALFLPIVRKSSP